MFFLAVLAPADSSRQDASDICIYNHFAVGSSDVHDLREDALEELSGDLENLLLFLALVLRYTLSFAEVPGIPLKIVALEERVRTRQSTGLHVHTLHIISSHGSNVSAIKATRRFASRQSYCQISYLAQGCSRPFARCWERLLSSC